MRGHNICFHGEIRKIILSILSGALVHSLTRIPTLHSYVEQVMTMCCVEKDTSFFDTLRCHFWQILAHYVILLPFEIFT